VNTGTEIKMPDDYLTKREFDGFSKTVRDGFNRLGENLTQVSSKIDTLVNGRIEEARVIGEISSEIRAINTRLERQERETIELRRLQETEVASLKVDIKEVRDSQDEDNRGKINWFTQLAMLIISAIAGGMITKSIK